MFYTHFVLAKKGPLARIWLAAHWDKKLTKAHVFETNIESSVEGILKPKVKMALRTNGHLLLGIVRIYSRKAKYLLADCNEAFIKIKIAFRPGVVDLPEANREAAVATITLPEVFHDFDSAMPDIDVDAPLTLNQSRAEDITLKEDYGTLNLIADDNFGDLNFDDPEMARDATNIDEGFDHASLLLGEDKADKEEENQSAKVSRINLDEPSTSHKDIEPPVDNLKENEFDRPEETDDGLMTDSGGGGAGLFEPGDLFDDAPLGHVSVPMETSGETSAVDQPAIAERENRDESDDDDMYDMGPASMGCPSPPSSPGSPAGADDPLPPPPETMVPEVPLPTLPDPEVERNLLPPPLNLTDPLGMNMPPPEMPPPPFPSLPSQPEINKAPPPIDQTTLIHNEEETFALVPVDSTALPTGMGGVERTKTKRKRKLIVDEVKNISGEEMKAQLSDTTDIVTTLDLAPPTKRLMHWKETGGVEKLFALPGRPLLSKTLLKLYQRHLTTRPINHEFEDEPANLAMDEDTEQNVIQEEELILPPPKRRRITMPSDDDSAHSLNHQMLNSHHGQTDMPGPSNSLILPPPIQLPPLQPEMARPDHNTSVPLVPPIRINLSKNRITTPDPSFLNISHPPQPSIVESPPLPIEPETSLPNNFMFPQVEEPSLQSIAPPVNDQSSYNVTVAQPGLEETNSNPAPFPILNVTETSTHLPPPIVEENHLEEEQRRQILDPVISEHSNERLQEASQEDEEAQRVNNNGRVFSEDEETIQQAPFSVYNPPSIDPRDELFNQQLENTNVNNQESNKGNESEMDHNDNQINHDANQVNHIDNQSNQVENQLCNDDNQLHNDANQMNHIDNKINHLENQMNHIENQMHHDGKQMNHVENQMHNDGSHINHVENQINNDGNQTNHVENQIHNDGNPMSHVESQLRDDGNQMNHVENQMNNMNYDDDDDYGAPASVGLPDEQAADETYEQFEERIINKRTTHMLHMIQHKIENDAEVNFHDLVRGNNRKQVAQKFYTFLVLKKQQAVELRQDEPYGPLIISKGAKYTGVY